MGKEKSTFKLINYPNGAEMGKPIEEIRNEAFKLYEKIKLHGKIDIEEIKKFLLEVYYS